MPKVYWVFAVLPLLTLWTTIFGQYIFRLDMIISPVTHFNLESLSSGVGLYNSLVPNAILWVFNVILPAYIVQKMLLFAILFGGQISFFWLARTFVKQPAAILAAVFYMFNPFTLDRLMAGQWWFLAGYAFLPLIMLATKQFASNKNGKIIPVIASYGVAAALSPHALIIGGLVIGASLIAFAKHFNARRYVQLVIALFASVAWWALPSTANNNVELLELDSATTFQAVTDPEIGVIGNLLTLHGFWREDWLLLKDINPIWMLLFLILFVVAGAGIGVLLRTNRRLVTSLLILGIFGLFFAAGLSSNTSSINSAIIDNIPGFSAFRESQKMLALYALVFSLFIAIGSNLLLAKKQLFSLSAAAIILVSSPFWFAARGQITAVTYSQGWQQMRTIADNTSQPRILALPWSAYVDGTFAQTLHAHPASANFGDIIVTNQDAKLDGVADRTPAEFAAITLAVEQKNSQALTQALQTQSFTHIFVLKSTELTSYSWFTPEDYGQVVYEDEQVIIISLTPG